MLFCHICKLNKLYVAKRFCILFKQSLWELIGFVWCEVSDCETEMWIIFFSVKIYHMINESQTKKQAKMVAQVVAGFHETSPKKLTYHHNIIQNRQSCVIP